MKLFIISLFSFLLVPTNEFHWPEDWGSTMTLSVYYYGGMTPESWSVKITNSTCVYEKNDGTTKRKYDFYPSKQELRDLIKVLKNNHLTKIKTHMSHGITYDKPTFGFTFQADNHVWTANSGASVEVDHKWEGSFKAIEDSVMSLTQKHMQKQKLTIIYKIDPSIQNAGKKLNLFVEHGENGTIDFGPKEIPSMFEQKLLPGEYHVHAYLTNEQSDINGSKIFSEVRTSFETSHTREFLLKLDGKKLVFEPR